MPDARLLARSRPDSSRACRRQLPGLGPPAASGHASCHDCQVHDELPPPRTRRDRLWEAAEARHIPLRAILVSVAVVALAYLAGKLVYRLRDVILLMVVAGFLALILNPVVLAVQRAGIRRRGWAVAVVTVLGLIVFFGL